MNLSLVHWDGKTEDNNFQWQTDTTFSYKVINSRTNEEKIELFKEWFKDIFNIKNPQEKKEYFKHVNYIRCKLKEGYKFIIR
jgi:hypothetical protein